MREAGLRGPDSAGTLDFTGIPPEVEEIVRNAYADATGLIFFISAVVTVVTLVAVWLMPETELRTTVAKPGEEPAERPEGVQV